jgi:hypothetical protein
MKFTTAFSSFLLAAPALAQTPIGFAPSTNVTLDVYYGTQYISPGLIVKKSSLHCPTSLQPYQSNDQPYSNTKSPNHRPNQYHVIRKIPPRYDWYYSLPLPSISCEMLTSLTLDIDGSSGGRATTVLHALLSDYAPANTLLNNTSVLKTSATGPSSYFGPAPPAGTPATHRYVFVLHEQPANFAVPAAHKQAVSSRFGIDWVAFVKDAGLKAPVAGNYLQVRSGDNTRRWEA